MSTLKELQLSSPIGTKFHLSSAVDKHEYVYFDGVYWKNHEGLLWTMVSADSANWEVHKETLKWEGERTAHELHGYQEKLAFVRIPPNFIGKKVKVILEEVLE